MLEEELLTPKALDSTVRYCLNQVGLGGMWGMCFIFEEVLFYLFSCLLFVFQISSMVFHVHPMESVLIWEQRVTLSRVCVM